MSNDSGSIFKRYYSNEPFKDRYLSDPKDAMDVIIPVIHSNELWEVNLRSMYREIPIHRLLIADGGCIDNTVEIAKKFPRVVVLDHREYKTLGYSERKLIEAVETDWFMHTHSDVFLPDGWFDTMKKYKGQYDYYGRLEQRTIMVEIGRDFGVRPWAGAQMVRTKCLEGKLSEVEDDYIYRQGDFVYRRMVEEGGFKEGYVKDTFHYHQTMHRPSAWLRKVTAVNMKIEMTPQEEIRTCVTMAKGIVKYLPPPVLSASVVENVDIAEKLGELSWKEFYVWVKNVNPAWLPVLQNERVKSFKQRLKTFLRAAYHLIFP